MKEKFLNYIFLAILLFACSTENEKNTSFNKYEWKSSNFSEQNIDSTQIKSAFNEASKLDYIYSMLVIRNGDIVAEKYFNGKSKDSYYKIRSVSKSFLSAGLGIAINNGVLLKDEKLLSILPEFKTKINDSRYSDVKIDHLIKMRAGLQGDRDIYSTVFNSSDWLSAIFNLPLISDPGTRYKYSTPSTHLLSAALSKSSDKTSLEFLTELLTSKMGIEINDWEQDPQGIYFGGNNMYFTTRNMAVLGLLYLNNGMLNGKQIVPKTWVEESLLDYTNGLGNWGVLENIGYGYLWWTGTIKNYQIFTAIGHGGQFVLCVPDLNLIVATNAYSNIWWEEANEQELAILNIIGNYIIPAVN